MYNSHPLEASYGNPGFFVDKPRGETRDASGRVVDLNPKMEERHARRILIQTSELPEPEGGVYTARIRRARGVTGIRLAHAAVPRSVRRVTAQLVLYSIPIKMFNSSRRDAALQQLCRRQLLSKDTSDFPFFEPTSVSPAGVSAQGGWVASSDKKTEIPFAMQTQYANEYIDVDTLTVSVPEDSSMHELGLAFKHALENHTGSQFDRNNSLWKQFGISVTASGFTAFENASVADKFNTFASFKAANEQQKRFADADAYSPMGMPVTIKMDVARSVFVNEAYFEGAIFSPASPPPSNGRMREFKPELKDGGFFEVTIDKPEVSAHRVIYSFNTHLDVRSHNIASVSSAHEITIEFGDIQTTDSLVIYFRSLIVSEGNTTIYYYYNVEFRHGTIEEFFGQSQVREFYHNGTKFSIQKATIKYPDRNDIMLVQRVSGGSQFLSNNYITITQGPNSKWKVTVQSGDVNKLPTQDQDPIPMNIGDGSYLIKRDGDEQSFVSLIVATADESGHFIRPGDVATVFLDNERIFQNVSEVTRTFQKTRDVRMALKWQGKTEDADFFIDANDSFESPMVTRSGRPVRRDVAAVAATSDAPTIGVYNAMRSVSELEDTYVPGSATEPPLFPVRSSNDYHQIDRVLFAGHMMTVSEPTPMDEATTQTELATTPGKRPGETSGSSDQDKQNFYGKGLGWQTAAVSGASRFVMPAHPVRFTEYESGDSGDGSGSIYQRDSEAHAKTSVSPLVSRILHSGIGADRTSFYDRAKVSDGTVLTNQQEVPTELTYYKPRTTPETTPGSSNAIVVALGGENYTIKSARLVSVLRNETDFHLDASCDRHDNAQQKMLSSQRQIAEIARREAAGTQGEREELRRQREVLESTARILFYDAKVEDGQVQDFVPRANAEYFSWCFELDRPVALPVRHRAGEPGRALVPKREFNGLADDAAMMVPGVYHEATGRPHLGSSQEAPYKFHVRGGTSNTNQPMLLLHGLGNVERPTNSTHGTSEEAFALFSTDKDPKYSMAPSFESTKWMHTPLNLNELRFSFVSSTSREKVELHNLNATIVLDVYCQND